MRVRFVRRMEQVLGNPKSGPLRTVWREPGYLHEAPDAYLLVRCGVAVPADAEAAAACRMTAEQMEQAQERYEFISRGYNVEDIQRAKAGIISGYTADGDYIPGENAALEPGLFPDIFPDNGDSE